MNGAFRAKRNPKSKARRRLVRNGTIPPRHRKPRLREPLRITADRVERAVKAVIVALASLALYVVFR